MRTVERSVRGWMRRVGPLVTALASSWSAFAVDPVTVEFQQGGTLSGTTTPYLSGVDRTIGVTSATASPASSNIDGVSGGNNDERQYFVQFNQIFGGTAGLVPLGATILDAQLTLRTTGTSNSQSNGRFVVAGMQVPFTSVATLSELGTATAAIATNGPVYANGRATLPVGGYREPGQNAFYSAFVAPVVQGWSSGSLANNGLVVQAHTTDAWQVFGNGDTTLAFRPKLSVTYTTAPTTTSSLVPGVNGYSGMTIVQMHGLTNISLDVTNTTSFGIDGPTAGVAPGDVASPDLIAMLKFDGIFGSGASQVPARAQILKSWFVATTGTGTNDQSNGPWSLYRMNAPWSASTLYSSYGPAGPVAGTDYDATAVATVAPMEKNQQAWFDITADARAWQSGTTNNGFLIRTTSTTDGWNFGAAGSTDPNRRPDLRMTYTIDPLVWKGDVSAAWDVGTGVGAGGTSNWQLQTAGTATNFIDTDRVVFGDSAAGTGDVAVSVAAAVAPQLVTIDNPTRNYTFSGAGGIAGAGRLQKLGAGTATLETANAFTGGTTVTAGTLRVGSGGTTGTISGPLAVAAGATLEFNRAGTLAVAGPLSGAGTLVKNGAGRVTVDGAHTFTGPVQVNAGSLALSPFTHTGGVTVANGGTFVAASGLTPATLSTTSLTLGSTASGLGFDLQSPTNPTVPLLAVTQADGLVLSGGAHTISVTTAGAIQPGRFTLIDYSGAPITAGFSLASLPARLGAALVFDDANTKIDIDVTGTQTPKWAGGVSNVWDAGSAVDVGGVLNWAIDGLASPTNFIAGDQVIFDDTGAEANVALVGTLTPGSVRVDNTAVNYAFTGSGAIGGAGLLTKAGPGTLSLLAAHQSTAGLAVTAGTVDVGNATTAGSVAGPVSVAAGSTFRVRRGTAAGLVTVTGGLAEVAGGTLSGGATVTTGTLAIGAGGSGSALAGAVSVAAGGTLAFDVTDNVTYTDALSGDGAVTKAGPGRVIFTGISPFTGSLTINGGTFMLDDQSVGGDLNATSIVVNNGGTFQFGNNTAGNPDLPATTYVTANTGGTVIWQEVEDLGGLNLAGGTVDLQQGGFTASGLTAQQWTAGTLTGTGLTAQTLNGAAAVEKTGSGSVSITGNASVTVTGGLNIREGVVSHAAAANLGTSPVTLGGATTAGTFAYAGPSASRGGAFAISAGGGGISVTDSAATLTLTGAVTGTGPLTKTGPGTAALVGAITSTGPFSVQAGTLAVAPHTAAASVTVADAATFAVTYGATPATMSLPQLTLGATGSGIGFALSGASNPAVPLVQVTTADGLALGGGTHGIRLSSVQSLSVGRFTLIDYDGAPITSGFTLASLPPRVTGSIVYDTAATKIDLDITGTGQVKWRGATSTTWDTGTAIDVGGTANWIDTSTAAATNFVSGDRVLFDDTATSGAVALAAVQDAAEVTVNNATLAYTLAGPGSLGGTGLLTKRGTGRLNLAATDARTGATTISGGTLAVGTSDTAGSLAGPVSVGFGGTLEAVNGTVGGAVTVTGGTARLAGGSLTGAVTVSSGELVVGAGTLTGNVAVAAGGQITVDRTDDLTYSQTLSGAGTVVKNGTGTLGLLGYNRTFTGNVVVNAGTVLVDDLGVGGDLYATGIVVNNGGTFRFGPNGNADFPGTTVVTLNPGGLYDQQQGENFGGVILDGGEFRMSGATKTGVSFTAELANGLDLRSGSITTAFTGTATGGEIRPNSASVILEKTTTGTVVLGAGVTLADTLPVNVRAGTLAVDIAALKATGSGEVLLGDAGAATLRVDGAGAGTLARYTLVGAPGATVNVADAGGTVTATALIDGTGSLTKAGPGTLVVAGANSLSGPTTVAAGTLRLTDGGGLASSAVTVGGGSLEVAAGVTARAPSVTVSGGTLSAGSLTVGPGGITSLAVNRGTVAGSPSLTVLAGGTMSLSDTGRLTVAAATLDVDDTGGRVDLGAGQITIAAGGSTPEQLRADIIAGRNGGSWNGTAGIASATAAAAAAGTRAVGYSVAGDGSARVSYAAPGDSNLDGRVNFSDIQAIISGGRYGQASPTGVWANGDFNYDGLVNFTDIQFLLNAGAYGQASYFPAAPAGASSLGAPAVVPEPGLGWLGLAVAAGVLAARRWRRPG